MFILLKLLINESNSVGVMLANVSLACFDALSPAALVAEICSRISKRGGGRHLSISFTSSVNKVLRNYQIKSDCSKISQSAMAKGSRPAPDICSCPSVRPLAAASVQTRF